MDKVEVVALNCVERAWTRNTETTGMMRREAERMVDALERWDLTDFGPPRKLVDEWDKRLSRLKGVIGKW